MSIMIPGSLYTGLNSWASKPQPPTTITIPYSLWLKIKGELKFV
jgi:hypothetical protein